MNAAQYFRNQTTHAARLAAHQRRHPSAFLREYRNRPSYYAERTLAEHRAAAITAQGPEMSSPDHDGPTLLWLDPSARTLGECTPDRNTRPAYPLKHAGWYTHDDDQHETIASIALILPEFPKLVFPAIMNSEGEAWRVLLDESQPIEFDGPGFDYDDAEQIRADAMIETVIAYDRTAELEAESEREYQRKEDARREIEENRETRQALRDYLRDLIHEARTHCDTLPPTISKTITDAIQSARADLNSLALENRQLSADL